MNLLEANSLALDLLDKHGLWMEGWTFDWDNARKRWGLCNHNQQIITASRILTELNSEEEFRQTILHEIAHALVGGRNGHNWKWRMKYREIGGTGGRTGTGVTAPPKFEGKCPSCELKVYRDKRTRGYHGACRKIHQPVPYIVWTRINP